MTAEPAISQDQLTSTAPPVEAGDPRRPGRRRSRGLGLSQLSGVYVGIVLIVAYSLWEPSTFLTTENLKAILSDQAITGILTMGLIISLICGMFDVSVAANMSWSITFVGWLQSSAHLPPLLAVILTLGSGALIGAVNATVISRLNVEPVIATLAMQSILAALSYWIADGQSITTGISPGFVSFCSGSLWGISLPVYYFLGVALIVWQLLEHTTTGRYLYAIGANSQAARLSGVPSRRLQYVGLILSGVIASFAGVVFTARIGSASFAAGTPYLLPAFAAAFLGSTQIRRGRFNVWGTVVAIFLLAVGIKGLTLHYPSSPWISDLFQGVVLIVAVAIASRAALRRRRAAR